MPSLSEQLTVIVVSWNTKALLRESLGSLLQEVGKGVRIYVVDNNSHDGSAAMVRDEFPSVHLIANPENVGFGRANNQVLKDLLTPYVLLLNPDTKVEPGAVALLTQFMNAHPEAGIVAPQLINPDGSVQRSCRAFPSIANMFYELSGLSRMFPSVQRFRDYKMLDFDHISLREVDQPEGACLLIRKSALDQVGLFDESFFMLFEEVDLCYRIKQAGWQIWFDPESKIVHYYGQSIKQVKAKMIYNSHLGFYRYTIKHSNSRLLIFLRPLLYTMLMLLAGIRILINRFKNAFAH